MPGSKMDVAAFVLSFYSLPANKTIANPANPRHFIVITKTECQLGILSGWQPD